MKSKTIKLIFPAEFSCSVPLADYEAFRALPRKRQNRKAISALARAGMASPEAVIDIVPPHHCAQFTAVTPEGEIQHEQW